MEEPEPILTPCSSGRRKSCSHSNSPEFEFWMVGNPSFPQPTLLSADELFSHGVLLPLHHLHLSDDTPARPPQQPEPSGSDQAPDPETSTADLSAPPALTSSKRWKDIFRKNEKKIPENIAKVEKDSSVKEKRKDKKNGGGGVTAAELNINIWPFSRSRSAGNGGTRPRSAATASRKVSSAPCSRSNSRKVPSSPSRAGVHLGRSSPVWQVRRRSSDAVVKKDGNDGRRKVAVAGGSKARVLSLNVPMCIGYRHQLSCRSDESSACGVAAAAVQNGGGVSGEGVRGSNLFNIKSLFTRKVY